MEVIMDEFNTQLQITRGTGAGGANTNGNGLPYEQLTDLETEYDVLSTNRKSKTISFRNFPKELIVTKQSNLFKCMQHAVDTSIIKAHGCKNPDECFIKQEAKIIFILEKKFQQVGGSVCEKIQTPDFKVWQYSRSFPDYRIVYMYCLSDWFKDNCKAELEYLEYKNIPVFWGNDTDYKTQISSFIVSYE